MKTEKKKSKESLIGKIIYGFLLFMPLLSVLVTCLYVIQNDNAHESYYGETINEEKTINTNNLKPNTEYTFNYLSTNEQNLITQTRINVNKFELVYTNLTTWQTSLTNIADKINTIYFWVNAAANNQQNIQFYYIDENDTQSSTTISLYNNNSTFGYITFKFTNVNNITISNEEAKENITYIEYNKYSYLDDAFMYGLQKTEDSQYFNWAKNTALYTGVNEFTNALGITTTYIPFLMTYWLLISVVYLIYDIALMMLHMAHNKIHQLEGSI